MTKRRFTPVDSNGNTSEGYFPAKKLENVPSPNGGGANFKTLFIIACVAILVLGYFAFFGGKGSSGGTGSLAVSNSEVLKALGTSYIEIGKVKENVQDTDDPTNKVTYWQFSDVRGNWNFCSVITMPDPFPNVILITDATLKISKVKNITDFSKAGADRRAEYNDAMKNWEGRSLVDFSSLERSSDEGDLRKFRELLRDGLAKTLKVMCVEEYGQEWFAQNFPQGIKFSRVGTKLQPWRVQCEDGREISDGTFAGRKYAFMSASSCGSCRATISEISQDMRTRGGMSPDQIIMIFTGKPEEKDKMKTMMAGEYLVLDADQANFCKMISFTEGSPAIMLIDQNGMVYAKEGAASLNDAQGRDKLLQGYYSAK